MVTEANKHFAEVALSDNYGKPEGEWISRDGHLEQVFQSNV